MNVHVLCSYFPGIMYSQRACDSRAIKSNSIGWLFYKTLSDWLSSISGRAERCRVECASVHNGLAAIRLVFLVKVYVRCKGILFNSKGSSLPRICLKVYGRLTGFDWKRLEVFVLHWFTNVLQVQFVEAYRVEWLPWQILQQFRRNQTDSPRRKKRNLKSNCHKKAVLFHREIFQRLAWF